MKPLRLPGLIEHNHLIDAYCGVGTIGFAFAKKSKVWRGMMVIPEAIEGLPKKMLSAYINYSL